MITFADFYKNPLESNIMGRLYMSRLLPIRRTITFFLSIGLILFADDLSAQCHSRFTVASTACANSAVTFTNNSTSTVDTSYWTWTGASTGDTTFLGKPNFSTTFTTAGNVAVCLTVVDTSTSCSDSTCKSITITA